MLTAEGCRERKARLWSLLPKDCDWVLIGDPRHVQYFSGFRVNPISFSADQKSLLLLTRDEKSILLADNFTRRCAVAEYFVDQEAIIQWYTHRKTVSNRDDALCDALNEVRNVWSTGSGLIEPEGISEMVAACVAEHAEWQFPLDDCDENVMKHGGLSSPTTLGTLIRGLRRTKHSDEIELLKKCMRACEAGHRRAFEVVRPGVTELEVYLEVQKAAQSEAGIPCIVYGDFRATNADLPKAGGQPTTRRLQNGDLFILDYSVVIAGYRSDFTNTIAAGTPTADQTRQFEACIESLDIASVWLKHGFPCYGIYEAASNVLQRRGFGPLAHHAGHGLGLEHPERPILVSDSTDILQSGDVITLEPGCYVPGVGGMRFEHNYLITEEGAIQLSQHTLSFVPPAGQ